MPTDRIVITGALVLVSGETSARPADIVLEGDTIAAIVPPGQAQAERVIDASDRLIIPGLINAHTHGHGGLGKGIGDRLSLELLLNANNWIQGGRTGEDRYISTLLSGIEMIRKGCTACIDLTSIMPVPSEEALAEVARAYDALGMRAVIAPMLADRSFYQAIPGLMDEFPGELRPIAEAFRTATAEAAIAPMRAAAKTWSYPRDRIRLGMAPTIPLHCSDDLMTACRDLAAEYGMPLQTHLAESPVQRTAAERRYGTTLTAHLAKLGLIGPGFSGAHAVWLDPQEIETIARLGGTLAHNPGSNLRLGNGIADMRRAVAAGVMVGVGTDGSASSDNQNMFEAMRLTAFLSRIYDRPAAEWFSAAEALRLATEGSAAVLGMADIIGKIAAGVQGRPGVPRPRPRQPRAVERCRAASGQCRGRGGGARRDDRRAVRDEGPGAAGDRLAGDRVQGSGRGGAPEGGERAGACGGGASGAGGRSFLRRVGSLRTSSAAAADGGRGLGTVNLTAGICILEKPVGGD